MSPYMAELRRLVGPRLLLQPAVAGIIHNEEGRVLLVRTTHEAWNLPAGAIDPGETPREAVVREVREETGLEVRPTRLIDVFGGSDFRVTYPNGDILEATVCVFGCDVIGGELHFDGVETTAGMWADPAEAAQILGLGYPPSAFTPP